ncbi:MAG: hypothetical protein QOF27_93, partial [Gaiellaceae bacterium]|nr:hypothetical protein [Gaiellaceae bacterium]
MAADRSRQAIATVAPHRPSTIVALIRKLTRR